MNYLFTSESVSEGHPDKVADQISDAILDQFLAYDPNSKVGCETLVTTGQVVIAGEVKSNAYVDLHDVVRNVIRKIGYNRSELKFDADACGLLSALHEQSVDINRGVEREEESEQGAGDQGMMFGYAVNETANRMPLTLELSHRILHELSAIRNEGKEMTYLRPDSKSQVTVEYDGETRRPVKIHTIVVSTQHDEFDNDDAKMQQQIEADVRNILIPRALSKLTPEVAALYNPDDIILHVNPTGKFVIGGPHGDAGLTGRKIIVDTYGGRGAHGGGAFSGKDPSKVDRSAAYAARHIARNLVAAGIADEVLVQVAYAIGVAKPVSLYVNTYGTTHVNLSDAEISAKVNELFDMRPHAIEQRFGLRKPIYSETSTYGHFGRQPQRITKRFHTPYEKEERLIDVELFAWEKEDMVEPLKKAFNL
ncbi:MAG: methionine adenosyltransferase [Bacteroides sp.]|nr:methionine adenosyltransferase [Bacteroides sp.]MCM1378665.1 methionine adenosyltransferase [Bacteroides sp.]MCM1444938.1 methionine adenosyltransferase [Prevotella sp.]